MAPTIQDDASDASFSDPDDAPLEDTLPSAPPSMAPSYPLPQGGMRPSFALPSDFVPKPQGVKTLAPEVYKTCGLFIRQLLLLCCC
jgi:hypothetical protein